MECTNYITVQKNSAHLFVANELKLALKLKHLSNNPKLKTQEYLGALNKKKKKRE